MEGVIRELKRISNNINSFILSNNDICVDRSRKNDILDAVLYKLYYTKNDSTQEKATIKLNTFKKKSVKSTRQSLVKKENKIDSKFYEKLSNKLANEIKRNNKDKYTKTIIAVDGTFPTLLSSMTNDGYKSNKKNESVTPLVSGLYNVSSNYPVMLDLVKTKDERKAFIDFVKNKDRFKGNVFVFDRGYVSDRLFKFMDDNKLFYLCRLRENSKYITLDPDYQTTLSSNNLTKTRIVKYTINNKHYYMATNLFDLDISTIQQMYHSRWSIEEYFKYIKKNMNLAKINEKREKDVRKTILAQLIVSQLAFIFVNMNKKEGFANKIVNKSILSEGIYDRFLYNFFKNKNFTKYFLISFIKTYVQYINTNKGKQSKHTCKRPNYRWYFKKFFNNVKAINT